MVKMNQSPCMSNLGVFIHLQCNLFWFTGERIPNNFWKLCRCFCLRPKQRKSESMKLLLSLYQHSTPQTMHVWVANSMVGAWHEKLSSENEAEENPYTTLIYCWLSIASSCTVQAFTPQLPLLIVFLLQLSSSTLKHSSFDCMNNQCKPHWVKNS